MVVPNPFGGAVGFGNESHGAFGGESFSGINNYGSNRNNQFAYSHGHAAFSSYAHIGNNINGDHATGVTNTPFGPYSPMNYYA